MSSQKSVAVRQYVKSTKNEKQFTKFKHDRQKKRNWSFTT